MRNATFLRHLRRTGNVHESARQVCYGEIQHRRRAHSGFSQRWDAGDAMVQARLRDGRRVAPRYTEKSAPHRTERLQVRRAQPDKLTKACEQACRTALSATASISLSAAGAGARSGLSTGDGERIPRSRAR